MSLSSIIAQLFYSPGLALQDGNSIKQGWDWEFSAASGIIAHAGGGQANGTPLAAALNEIDTCASDSDSVVLPPAIPGRKVRINNNTAHTLAVFGVAANGGNAGAGDTIAAQGSTTQQPTATGVTQLTAVDCMYTCYKLGQWKQGSVT